MTITATARAAALMLLLATAAVRAETPTDRLDQAPSRYTRMDSLRIHYKALGQGPTALVLVHGWSCDHTFWREQAAYFADQIRVVVPDLPGHGRSDRPRVQYSINLFARAVEAVLRDAQVASAVLVGHSMGTPVVRQYARLYPNKTKALVAVDGSLRRPVADPRLIEQFAARFEGPQFREAVGQFVDSLFRPDAPAGLRDQVKARMQGASPHVAGSAMRNMLAAASWQDEKVGVPLQAIMAQSPAWSADYEAFVRRLAPTVDYQVMTGAGHFLMLERPKEFNALLARFLRQQGLLP